MPAVMPWALIISVLSFLVAFFVLALATAHWRQTRVNRSFVWFTLSVTGWMLMDILFRLPQTPPTTRALLRLEPVFWIVAGALFLDVVYGLTARATDRLLWGFRAIAAISVVLALTTGGVFTGYAYTSVGVTEQLGPLFFPLATLNLLAPAGVASWLLIREIRLSVDSDRRRLLRTLLVSLAVPMTLGFAADVVLPQLVVIANKPELTPAAVSLFCVGLVAATTRHRFLQPNASELLADVFRHSPDGVALLDADHHILRINDPARDLLDLPQGKTLSAEQLQLLTGSPDEPVDEPDRHRLHLQAGHRVLAVHRSLLRYTGRQTTLLVFLRDVTRSVALEERNEESKRLEAVSTLAGGAAHYLNNILSVSMLISSSQLALLPSTDPLRREMETILRAAERGRTLIEDLLAFTQGGVTRLAPPGPVDLNALLRGWIDARRAADGEWPPGVEVLWDLAPELPATLAHEKQLERVLDHVIRNAIEAMDEAGTLSFETSLVTLSAEAAERPPELSPGRYLRIHISDTGPGMDEQTRVRACEPFYTTKGLASATGLGLAVVYGTMASLNGSMTLESAPGQGTVVTLELPVDPEPPPP